MFLSLTNVLCFWFVALMVHCVGGAIGSLGAVIIKEAKKDLT
jgi:hypothetical protein